MSLRQNVRNAMLTCSVIEAADVIRGFVKNNQLESAQYAAEMLIELVNEEFGRRLEEEIKRQKQGLTH